VSQPKLSRLLCLLILIAISFSAAAPASARPASVVIVPPSSRDGDPAAFGAHPIRLTQHLELQAKTLTGSWWVCPAFTDDQRT